jgi:polysaccharide pyruvyl transferase WcaK-like protein
VHAVNPIKILVAGATGYGNIGDDAIRNRIVESIASSPHPVEILCTRPYPQPELVDWCDGLVLGGGGIVYDSGGSEHGQSNFDYFFGTFLKLAKKKGKPVCLSAVGVDGITDPGNASRFRDWASAITHASVRMPADGKRLGELGLGCKIVIADDIASLGKPSRFRNTAPGKRKKACVIPQALWVEKFSFESLEWTMGRLASMGYDVYVASTSVHDTDVCTRAAKLLGFPGSVRDYLFLDEPALISLLGEMDLVLSSRFHGLIFARAGGCPSIFSLGRGAKLANQVGNAGVLTKLIVDRDADTFKKRIAAGNRLGSFGDPLRHAMVLRNFVKSLAERPKA